MKSTSKMVGLVAALALACISVPSEPAHADNTRDGEWHIKALEITAAQAVSRGNGVIVGVIDTGVDGSHQDLLNTVLSGRDYVGNTDGRQDLAGHGTGMAGLIAGHGRNNNGILGVAPGAKILPVRVTNPTASGLNVPYRDGGFAWAAEHGARVICAAFDTHDTPTLRDDVNAAMAADVVVIAAAGNSPTAGNVEYPAALSGVLAVGGTGKDGQHDPNATSGEQVQISAPSVEIESTDKHGGYAVTTGTSDATAIVAGVAALIRSKYPTMSAAEVIHRLTATATDKGPPGRDPDYGYGIVNPVAALTANVPPLSPSPSPSTQTPATAQANPTSHTGVGPGTLTLLGVALLAVAAAGLSIAVLRNRRR